MERQLDDPQRVLLDALAFRGKRIEELELENGRLKAQLSELVTQLSYLGPIPDTPAGRPADASRA